MSGELSEVGEDPNRRADVSRRWFSQAARFGLWLALITLIGDQLHKYWMINVYNIEAKKRVAVAPFMDLVYVINEGISYGLLSQSTVSGQYMLAGLAFVVAAALAAWLIWGAHTLLAGVAIGLIVGGAVGNAIDRLHLGGVADFFSFHAFGYYWYVFNVADIAIVAGVIGLLYDSLIASRKGAAN